MRALSHDHLLGTSLGTYRLETFAGQDGLGLRFAAHGSETPPSPYLVRALGIPTIGQAGARTIFEDQFHVEASQLALLQHPYLLPLVGYGVARTMPYMVWPAISTRSLSSRLQSSGPLDVLTVGRYVDQIAAVLEYAHEHATLHGGLSTDGIYLRPDGQIMVGDLGVWRLVEQGAAAAQTRSILGTLEACAPEQLLGNPVDPRTDVYALGAVIYRLLSGMPVFTGNTMEEVAQQHLRAPILPLGRRRAGLPAALDTVLATAMAKDPAQRFPQPGALANAYHAIVAPTQTARVPFVATGAPALADWRRRTAPDTSAPTPGPQLDSWDEAERALAGSARGAPAPVSGPLSRSATSRHTARPFAAGSSAAPPREAPGRAVASAVAAPSRAGSRSTGRRRGPWNLVFVAAIVVVVAGTTLGLIGANSGWFAGVSHATGTALFVDSSQSPPGHTDAVRITVHDLTVAPSGSFYDAWLIDTASEHETALGTLEVQNGTYVLTDQGDGHNGAPGTNLLSLGNEIEITLEQGQVTLPVGHVVLKGAFPAQAFVHMQHLLVSFPTTPGKVALAVGVLDQAQLMDAEAQILSNAAQNQNAVAVQCAAQSIVDIIEGQKGAHYQPLASACAGEHITATGDGFGLLGTGGYLVETAQHASNAAIAPDSTAFIRTHAGHVEIATTNIAGWLTQLDQKAVPLLTNPAATSDVAQMVTLADHAYHGVDTNGDEQIDPVSGEAGAVTAYEHAQLMTTLTLTASA